LPPALLEQVAEDKRIEEATLYKHYREYWLKEKHELLTCKKIAGDFNSTESNVLQKLGLLDLPVNVQQKIINEDIPVGKAMALIKLTTADNLPQAQHVAAENAARQVAGRFTKLSARLVKKSLLILVRFFF